MMMLKATAHLEIIMIMMITIIYGRINSNNDDDFKYRFYSLDS